MSSEPSASSEASGALVDDADALAALSSPNPVVARFDVAQPTKSHLLVAVLDRPSPLSMLVPLVERLGLEVLDERSVSVTRPDGATVWVHDLGVRHPQVVQLATAAVRAEAERAFTALWRGDVEADGFNRLVISGGLRCHDVDVLRAYGRYLRQLGVSYSQGYLEDTLVRHAPIARRLVDLFAARLDPALDADRAARAASIDADVLAALDAVASLDEDRILRSFLAAIRATTRTNAWCATDGVLAFKLAPTSIPDAPLPRPFAEIWVSSPRVEGVHLRGGRVARGGLRWSDRKEDFRTEVLGLMKAQMVKNAVIVPTGAKGGFVVKRYDALAATDVEAARAEVVAAYRLFVGALLDLTDNVVRGEVVGPPGVVRHDGEDPYLVVAADKGTATFSDVANEIAVARGFWLGDAFASGGRTGYDHKALAITARGAWESVRRHFRGLGRDADADQLTVVGIGDMSGDVFGNGLLRSRHLKLVAAFDHRHVFLDPDPDPERSYVERQRLFALPRSSWADYDASLISDGGGVYPRSAKSIPISPAVQARLGTTATALSPAELIATMLRAPVDLLWNGGIGTYVKATTESNADVGDRSNDALRVDGEQLRCAVVAEGGNLGLTQRGRIEAALAGVLLNTDAVDNSAGVDCSDHEVNLKILLDAGVAAGRLAVGERNELLASVADDVSELVLDDNRGQTLELAIARDRAGERVELHARYLRALEAEGLINRELEFLPNTKTIGERQLQGVGLTTPEFAVLLAYTKTTNIHELLQSDVPDDPYVQSSLAEYFPPPIRRRFGDHLGDHRLRREIVGTALVNEMVNRNGITFDHRLTEETGASVADSARAWVVSRDVFAMRRWWDAIEALPSGVGATVQLGLYQTLRRLVDRGALWILRHRRAAFDLTATVAQLGPGVSAQADRFDELLVGAALREVRAAAQGYIDAGLPPDMARRAASWSRLHTALDVVEVASMRGRSVEDVGAMYWLVFEQLGLGWLWDAVSALPRQTRWQSQARSALRDDLLGALRALTDEVLRVGDRYDVPAVLVIGWVDADRRAIDRASRVLTDIRTAGTFDVTTLTVAVRQLRNLVTAVA